jgi:hypothetical protein
MKFRLSDNQSYLIMTPESEAEKHQLNNLGELLILAKTKINIERKWEVENIGIELVKEKI